MTALLRRRPRPRHLSRDDLFRLGLLLSQAEMDRLTGVYDFAAAYRTYRFPDAEARRLAFARWAVQTRRIDEHAL